MRLESFPNCCTAKILIGLGASGTAGYRGDIFQNDHEFCERARFLINQQARMGTAMIFAITNSDQVMAARCLPQLGFIKALGDVDKEQHKGTKVTSWVYRCTEEDARPKAVMANPFAKPEPPEPIRPLPILPQQNVPWPEPAPNVEDVWGLRADGWFRAAPVAGKDVVCKRIGDVIMHRFVGERDHEVLHWYRNNDRREVNARIRREFRRDAVTGRFLRLPAAGVIYTRDQLDGFYIPRDMRYRRIYDTGRGQMTHIGSRKPTSGMGLGHVFNGQDLFYVFA